MITENSENLFFSYILQNGEYTKYITERFFTNETYKEILPKVCTFYQRYKQTPSLQQIWELVQIDVNLIDKVTYDKLSIIWNYEISCDEVWLKETFEAWIEFKNLEFSLFDIVSYVKNEKITQDNIKDIVNKVKQLIIDKNSIDFSFNTGTNFFDSASHYLDANQCISTGINYLDLVLGGGWQKKALYCFAAPPKVGKSTWLGNIAAELIKNGHNVIFYTLEMSEKKVLQRIGSNLLNIPVKDYYNKMQDMAYAKDRLSGIAMETMKTPGNLIIKEMPTGQASALDLEAHCKKVEESTGQEYPFIICDYLGIMSNWRNPNSENMYLKGKQISEDVRAWMVRKNKCCITAIQTNKSAVNASDFSTIAVAESSGLNHTVDGMFGIIQDELMYANQEYFLKVLLNRNDGYKNVKKRFLVDYEFMRIEEDLKSEIIQGA